MPNTYEMHITCFDGVTTNAIYKVNGKIAKRAKAKCSPRDPFDFQIGMQEATDRIFIPTNKYESMSNSELDREMCSRGPCHAHNDVHRKHKCLFADDFFCPDITDANRADVIKYLLAEDAEAAPKPEDKPAEDTPEAMKLYCVKDYKPGTWVTKGKIYEVGADGHIKFDDGYSPLYDSLEKPNSMTDPLIPLVKRPANVGEWVYITHTDYTPEAGARLGVGDVCRVASVAPSGAKHLEVSPRYVLSYFDREYLVLDGYHAEAEPEYFSGKVVCVNNGGKRFFEVGKVYCFYDGVIFGANGFYSSRYETLEKANCGIGSKFIEFKGEA